MLREAYHTFYRTQGAEPINKTMVYPRFGRKMISNELRIRYGLLEK